MLTGTFPYPGDDMKSLVNWHLNEEIHDTHETLPDLPDEMHTFFMNQSGKILVHGSGMFLKLSAC